MDRKPVIEKHLIAGNGDSISMMTEIEKYYNKFNEEKD